MGIFFVVMICVGTAAPAALGGGLVCRLPPWLDDLREEYYVFDRDCEAAILARRDDAAALGVDLRCRPANYSVLK